MLKSIYDYPDYKGYLAARIADRGRGEKSRIAEAAQCHLAYVHQVLSGPADFSFEQADLLNAYLGHTEEEAELFLLLVSLSRAGSDTLRKRYQRKIARILSDRNVLENRLKTKKNLPEQYQATYYSAWYYSAIHLLLSIPEFRTKDAISERLRLSRQKVAQALSFLVETGLAKLTNGRYVTGEVALHLPNDSAWIARHHSSWRIQCVQSLEQGDPNDFHYTSVVSLDPADLPKIRKALVDAIESVRSVVKPSPEKDLVCYILDYFRV